MGIKMGLQKRVEVEAKTIRITAKCCDSFGASVHDQDGKQIGDDYDGQVPDFMPGNHHGDYVELTIDLESGKILNWQVPTAEDIEELVQGEDE